MYKNLVIVMLLFSAMQITCEVDNRVYFEKAKDGEVYQQNVFFCVRYYANDKVLCYQGLRNGNIKELPKDYSSKIFLLLKNRYEEQEAAKKSE
jgi:hypothetical protein